MNRDLKDRIIGRFAHTDIKSGSKTLVKKAELIDEDAAIAIDKAGLEEVAVRTVMECASKKGICQKCYGWDLGHADVVEMGTAVGIIAAQSIGEPGTQLTMRTFHTGGIASSADITQGLPRVEELFEARNPKRKAFISEVAGKVQIEEITVVNQDLAKANVPNSSFKQKVIRIAHEANEVDTYPIAKKTKLKVKDGGKVKADGILYLDENGDEVRALRGGKVAVHDEYIEVAMATPGVMEYVIPLGYSILVQDGQEIEKGTPLTEG